jgi:hypothetical protein
VKHLEGDSIVVSMTDFQRFKRCRKLADLTFHHGLEPLADKEVMARGRAFHAIMEAYALQRVIETIDDNQRFQDRLFKLINALGESDIDQIKAVAEQYILRRWNIAGECIGNIESPIYTMLLDKGQAWAGKHGAPSPALWLRNTPDLIYKDPDAWITGREYKTFEKAVNYDNDLDFQGKISMAVMQKHFNTRHARFEYINVRQTPPDVPKDKAGNVWREDECYTTVDFYPSDAELESIWRETQSVGKNLLGCLFGDDPFDWYRVDLKGNSPHTCGQCFVKNLCKDEAMQGGLSADTIWQYTKPREYVFNDDLGTWVEKPREFTPFGAEGQVIA